MAKGIKSENKKRINSKKGRAAMMLFGRYKVKAKEKWEET
ncbi:hypothetical protein C5S29_05975 [ANME-1 cluster archaeon GoMg3.2]|nr:hypothetical protein [ANME-1 cluster archaeon GoMg3.2]